MAYGLRPGERIRLAYGWDNPGRRWAGAQGVVICRATGRRARGMPPERDLIRSQAPRNVLVHLDDGRRLVVAAGNVRREGGT